MSAFHLVRNGVVLLSIEPLNKDYFELILKMEKKMDGVTTLMIYADDDEMAIKTAEKFYLGKIVFEDIFVQGFGYVVALNGVKK